MQITSLYIVCFDNIRRIRFSFQYAGDKKSCPDWFITPRGNFTIITVQTGDVAFQQIMKDLIVAVALPSKQLAQTQMLFGYASQLV